MKSGHMALIANFLRIFKMILAAKIQNCCCSENFFWRSFSSLTVGLQHSRCAPISGAASGNFLVIRLILDDRAVNVM